MKKTTLLLGLVTCLFVMSCRKTSELQNPPMMQTTQQDLRSGNTTVVLSDARNLAVAFLQRKSPGKTISITSAETIVRNGVPYIHILNAGNNAGFVMVAADSLYRPVLAYNMTGNFHKEDMNAGLARWFNKHGENIRYVRSERTPAVDSITIENKKMWLALGKSNVAPSKVNPYIDNTGTKSISTNPVRFPPEIIGGGTDVWFNAVAPLCTSTWGQGYPYNQYCPAGSSSGGHMPAGCVPVAMAQIMNYWQFPTTYNWSVMLPNAGTTESATLIHDIGITTGPVFMHPLLNSAEFVYYADNGSEANVFYAPFVFSVFGYPEPSRTIGITDQVFSGARNGNYYASLLRDEVLNNRPAMLSGFSGQNTILGLIYWPYVETGHAWVCDGLDEMIAENYDVWEFYDNDHIPINVVSSYNEPPHVIFGYLHMNWGWSGSNNGWYDYQTNYAYGPGVDQSYFQVVVYNIHP